MILSPSWIILAGVLAQAATADQQYKSRPDLSPPRLNISIPATEDVAPGYIFIGPYTGFVKSDGPPPPEQPAAYILRDDGDLVWSSLGYTSGWVANIQVTSWKGQPVISAFQGTLEPLLGRGWGHATIFNNRYEPIRQVHGGNHKIISVHEVKMLDSGSVLVDIYQPLQMDLTPYNHGSGASWIVDALFQEIDLDTGDLIFEWSSLEHIPPSESVVSVTSGYAGDGLASASPWDYFHLNSIDKDRDGNYLISARHTSAIYKINGTTGEILWKIGGSDSYFKISGGVAFEYQHDARFLNQTVSGDGIEYISFFDNGARENKHNGQGIGHSHPRSYAKIIRLDTTNWTATLVQSWASPEGLLAATQGNTQVLPNGNVFVNWGQAGTVTEFRAADGEAIFHAHIDSGKVGQVQNYRGFRFPWTGRPKETPAIAALEGGGGSIAVYVSWNGDTETVAWKFFALDSSQTVKMIGSKSQSPYYLGQARRTGFETSFQFQENTLPIHPLKGITIFAEAVGSDGKIVSRSGPTPIKRRPVASQSKKDGQKLEL